MQKRKKRLKEEMTNIKNEALAYALGEQEWDDIDDIQRKNRARFFRLRGLDREIIERKWREQNPNQDIEMDDFDRLLEIAKEFGFVK